jgi:hypothetical protein
VQFGPWPVHDEPTDGCCAGQVLQRQSPLKPQEHWVFPQSQMLPGSLHGDMFAGCWVGHGGPPVLELLLLEETEVLVVDPPPVPLLDETEELVVVALLDETVVAPPVPLLDETVVAPPPVPLLDETVGPKPPKPPSPVVTPPPSPMTVPPAPPTAPPAAPPAPPPFPPPPDPVSRTVVEHAAMPQATANERQTTILRLCMHPPSKAVGPEPGAIRGASSIPLSSLVETRECPRGVDASPSRGRHGVARAPR